MSFQNCPFDVTPYDQSRLIKTPNLINVNYTNQDFWSLKSRLVDYVKQKFGDNFNDFVESSLAVMLIENWAFIADTLSFKIDQIANEIFIDTVSETDNAFRLATLVGFKPQPPIGARAYWKATIANTLATDLIVDTPVIVDITTNEGPRTIELFPLDSNKEPIFDEQITISAGSLFNTNIVGLEGRTINQTQIGSGQINQAYRLNFGPVIWQSIRVLIDGMVWEEVDYFTDSQPRREFRVEYDHDYNAYIMFGNNRAGLIPSDGSEIIMTYRTGGGVSGNIVTGAISTQQNFTVPGLGFRVPVFFENYTRGEYGYPGDAITDIKRKLPPFLRTQDRAVTGDDYKTLADQYASAYNGQIGKSTAVLRNYGCAANIIDLYVLAKQDENDLAEASAQLKVLLQAEIDSKKMFTDYVCIKDGVVVEVDVAIDVVMDKFYKKFKDEIQEQITRRTNMFFDLNNWDFNEDLKSIDLITALSDIKQLKNIEVNFVTDAVSGSTITTKFYEIVRTNTIEINFIFE